MIPTNAHEALEQRVRLLKKSCHRFDEGDTDEFLNIAHSLRSLLHDTASTRSILAMSGQKSKIRYCDTRNPPPPKLGNTYWAAWCGLVDFDSGFRSGVFGYRAPLSAVTVIRTLDFPDWWRMLVFQDEEGHQLTRKDFVCQLANKDGPSHFDPDTASHAYRAAARSEHVRLMRSFDGTNFQYAKPMAVSVVRQIAHELLISLDCNYSCFPNPPIDFDSGVIANVGLVVE